MANKNNKIAILWLTPDKPDNISVGRERIRGHLKNAGFEITIRGTTRSTVVRSIRDRGEFDVVVGTTRLGAIAGLLVSRIHSVPLVVDHVDPIRQFRETHSRWQAAVVERLENLVFRNAAHVLYVYPEEESRVTRHAIATTKTNLGVEFERFANPDQESIQAARSAVGEMEDNIVVYVGGLEPIYSISTLLEAITDLDGWTLLLIGAGSREPAVREAARRRDDIVFPGTVPHEMVPGYLALANVGISLVDDPHTLKVLEYGIAELPVVQRAGYAEGRFGGMVTFCRDDPDDVSDAIREAYERGPSTELAEYAATLDWGKISDDYRQAITSVI